ncbi:MAG: D-aminoacyl-tRNA deacylase [Thermoplasmata archaeon]
MRLIVSSKSDPASLNIQDKLLTSNWKCMGEYMGTPFYRRDNDILVTVKEHHIYVDEVDKEVSELIGETIDLVVYISKHASKAGIHSLTVHPVGNFGRAKFGGKSNVLVPPAPMEMTFALRRLHENAKKMGLNRDYEVSFEVTHHGPYLTTPTYYIEIGSDKQSWMNDRAGKAVASTVIEQGDYEAGRVTTVVCIGGGHYAPHFTDMVKEKEVAVGHMVPGWALKNLTEKGLATALKQSKTNLVCVDPGGLKSSFSKCITKWCENIGAEMVEPSDI